METPSVHESVRLSLLNGTPEYAMPTTAVRTLHWLSMMSSASQSSCVSLACGVPVACAVLLAWWMLRGHHMLFVRSEAVDKFASQLVQGVGLCSLCPGTHSQAGRLCCRFLRWAHWQPLIDCCEEWCRLVKQCCEWCKMVEPL